MSITQVQDAFMICLISTLSALLTELISYHLIYKKITYITLKQTIEKNVNQIELLKRNGKDEKRRKQMEIELKKETAIVAGMRMYSLFLTSIIMLGLYQALKAFYTVFDTLIHIILIFIYTK